MKKKCYNSAISKTSIAITVNKVCYSCKKNRRRKIIPIVVLKKSSAILVIK